MDGAGYHLWGPRVVRCQVPPFRFCHGAMVTATLAVIPLLSANYLRSSTLVREWCPNLEGDTPRSPAMDAESAHESQATFMHEKNHALRSTSGACHPTCGPQDRTLPVRDVSSHPS